jgi:hypothetical protein
MMKKNLPAIAFLLLIVLFSCRKEPSETTFDYIGKYRCRHTHTCYGALGNCFSEDTVDISVRKGATDSTYSLFNGDYYIAADGCCSGYHFTFCFFGDSLHASFMNGGLGGGAYDVYDGVKISNIP